MKAHPQFISAAEDILSEPDMQLSKTFIQHGGVSVYTHSLAVAVYCYKIAKRMKLKVDMRSLVRGALLHDFFLYDWHHEWDKRHGFTHPKTALKNAERFGLNKKERDIIRRHMWPMTFINIPNCKEAWLVCFVDKYCSLLETFKINRYTFENEM